MRVLKVSAVTVWVVALAALAVAVGFLASCADLDFSPDLPPVGPAVQRDTPAHVLQYFCETLEGGFVGAYSEALAEGYRFNFMEEDWDRAGVTGSAPYWGKTEDVEAMQNLLESEYLVSITCDGLVPVVDPYYNDSVFVMICDVDLKVTLDDPQRGMTTYWVKESWLTFSLRPDPLNARLWVISEIAEAIEPQACTGYLLRAESATEPTTFGSIKAMFKPVPG